MKSFIALYVVVLLVAAGFVNPASAQIKTHGNLEIRVTTQVQQERNNYLYVYSIENRKGSTQKLESIRIEIGDIGNNKGGTISEITQKTTEGNKWAGWTSDAKAKPRNKNARGLVTWVADYDSITNISDMFLPPKSVIRPGESQQFSITSEGPPGLMRFWGRGWNEPYIESEFDSLIAAGFTEDQLVLPWYEDAFQGMTIAPVIPPDTLTNSGFLGLIDSYLTFSCDTTWITNHGICNSLKVKLRNVRRHLERDKPKQARNVLHAFINQVEAQRGKHITEEGYALLYFNAEYLLDKLDSGGGY